MWPMNRHPLTLTEKIIPLLPANMEELVQKLSYPKVKILQALMELRRAGLIKVGKNLRWERSSLATSHLDKTDE